MEELIELLIPEELFERIVAHARREAPVEACGILGGRDNRVEKLYEMANVDGSEDHFFMDPEEQFRVIKDIRNCGLEMMAIYHSHPKTQPRPSAEDIRLALTPEVVYVIVSLAGDGEPSIRGFTIEDGKVGEVPVKIGGE